MRIVSNEIQQVFKAYAKQLRVDNARGKQGQIRETRAKGFEKVEISDEARTLAANFSDAAQQSSSKQERIEDKNKKEEKSTENEEKETKSSKAPPDNDRNKEIVE